jgi:hypothetical protein
MKHAAIAVLMVVFLAAQAAAEEATVLKEQIEKDSYATGVALVRNLKQQGGSFDLDLVIKGMKDEITCEKLLLTEEGLRMILTSLQSERNKRQTRGGIEYADQDKASGKEDVPLTSVSSPQAPEPVRTPVRDQEQTLRALALASIAPPRDSMQKAPASSPPSLPASFQASAHLDAPVQEHTFAALALDQQQQANDDGPTQIVLSDFTRRHAEAWLKTLPH